MPTIATYCPFDLEPNPSALGLVEKSVKTKFGQIHFVRSPARRSDTVTVFLHGVGGSWVSWSPILQAARSTETELGDVLLLDLPGFGSSNRNIQNLDADEVGELIVELAGQEGWSKIRLLGHSMGGFLALNMASTNISAIEAVNIISGAYFTIIDTTRNPRAALQSNRSAAATYLGLRALSSVGPVGPWLARGAGYLHLMPFVLGSTVAHPRGLKADILRSMSRSVNPSSFLLAAKNGIAYDAEKKWSGISVPLKAIFGCHDKLVPPSDAHRLSEAVPGAKTYILSEAGHFAHVEQPFAVVEVFF